MDLPVSFGVLGLWGGIVPTSVPARLRQSAEPQKQNEWVRIAAVAQLVERVLGKDEVMGSIPISSFELGWLVETKQATSASRRHEFNKASRKATGKRDS